MFSFLCNCLVVLLTVESKTYSSYTLWCTGPDGFEGHPCRLRGQELRGGVAGAADAGV